MKASLHNLLSPEERECLIREVDEAIACQLARVELEKMELKRLENIRARVLTGDLPEVIEKVRCGMVTLDLLNLTRGKK